MVRRSKELAAGWRRMLGGGELFSECRVSLLVDSHVMIEPF